MSDTLAQNLQHLKMAPERLSELFAERGATVAPDVLSCWAEMGVPTVPSARLSRRGTAEALSMVGYPTTLATLNTLSTLGEGPLFDRYGQYAIYEWGDALAWAQSKSKGKRRSSSEGRSQEAAERARKNAKIARDVRDAMRAKAAKAKAETRVKTSAKARRRVAKTRGPTAEHHSTAAE